MNVIIPIITAIITGAIGYFIRYRIDKVKEISSQITEERREHYQVFINTVVDILNSSRKKEEINNQIAIEKIYGFYKRYLVYASPLVITSFGNYFQFLYHQNEDDSLPSFERTKKHFSFLSKIVKDMRKDLGLSNRRLGSDGELLFRAVISDFDHYYLKTNKKAGD